MQAIENIETILATPLPAIPAAESSNPETHAIHMRALRRKARRISAYARFSVEALTALAQEVESDLAALQH